MINVNEYCPNCVKRSVCEWTEKLYKLEGTKKKLGVLEITVDGCRAYLSSENDEDPEEE